MEDPHAKIMQTLACTLKYTDSVLFRKPDRGNIERKRLTMEWIKHARSVGVDVRDMKAELDSKKVLHYHGKVIFPKGWSYDEFRKRTTVDSRMRSYIVPMANETGWKNYIEEDNDQSLRIEEVPEKEVKPWTPTQENVAKEIAGSISLLRHIPLSQIEFGFGV